LAFFPSALKVFVPHLVSGAKLFAAFFEMKRSTSKELGGVCEKPRAADQIIIIIKELFRG
jgi:hypothetical protein